MCDQQSLRSACAYAQSDQSLCWSLEYSMIVKLLTAHHLEYLSLKGGCRGSSQSTHVKIPHCWKSHALLSNKRVTKALIRLHIQAGLCLCCLQIPKDRFSVVEAHFLPFWVMTKTMFGICMNCACSETELCAVF